MPGRLAFDAAELLPPLLFVKAGSLEGQREQDCPAASAPQSLFLGHPQDPAAEPAPPPLLRQEEAIDAQEAHRGRPEQTADNRAALRVRREDRERPLIAIARLAEIV